jgi:hypothetical protein
MKLLNSDKKVITLVALEKDEICLLIPLVHYLRECGWYCDVRLPPAELHSSLMRGLIKLLESNGNVSCSSEVPEHCNIVATFPADPSSKTAPWHNLTIPHVTIGIIDTASSLNETYRTYRPFSQDRSLHLSLKRIVSGAPLAKTTLLITGGSTPVPLDDIRVLTTQFTGGIALACAETLFCLGADITLVLGKHTVTPPHILRTIHTPTFQSYRSKVLSLVESKHFHAGIFSAAVADYTTSEVFPGKLPSKQKELLLRLQPTQKVIQEVAQAKPSLPLITFKFEAEASQKSLQEIALRYLQGGSTAVVANSGREMKEKQEHVAHIFRRNREALTATGKLAIAESIARVIIEDVMQQES